MRARGRRGFTLVELMIVVAIVGVLAALAIYGVRRYLRTARTSEARQVVGGIARAAVAAYNREDIASELLVLGDKSAGFASGHDVCNSATNVPAAIPTTKYQPRTNGGFDFDTGDDSSGWRCLRFEVAHPISYRYSYKRGTATQVAPNNPATAAGSSEAFEAAAEGDLDNDGTTSKFALTGKAHLPSQTMQVATQVYVENETE